MDVVFLGTGSAWSLPEHGCSCRTCQTMIRLGEERLRTALYLSGLENILVDCGPDIRLQMRRNHVRQIDALLITHGHGDHYVGLDELEALRRSKPRDMWTPLPVYATEKTWNIIERQFYYLKGTLLDKRLARPGEPLEGMKTRIIPFRTVHSKTAEGSVGYVFEEDIPGGVKKLVYTSDFIDVADEDTHLLEEPDVLIIQSHFFHEPETNRPGHMSFQRALEFIEAWRPRSRIYLVHLSDEDAIPGDKANACLKKVKPSRPMVSPRTGRVYDVPTCQAEWQERVDQICTESGRPYEIKVAHDGFRVHGRQA